MISTVRRKQQQPTNDSSSLLVTSSSSLRDIDRRGNLSSSPTQQQNSSRAVSGVHPASCTHPIPPTSVETPHPHPRQQQQQQQHTAMLREWTPSLDTPTEERSTSAASARTSTEATAAAVATPPVAPAVAVVADEQHQASPNGNAAGAVAVAEFVRDLVRHGMDHLHHGMAPNCMATTTADGSSARTSGPAAGTAAATAATSTAAEGTSQSLLSTLSVRSESAAMASAITGLDHPATATADALSARSLNDMLEGEAEAEFILVDGDLIAVPAPPPNHIEQREIESRIRRHQMSKFRRGVRKIAKLFRRGGRRIASPPSTAADAHYQHPPGVEAAPAGSAAAAALEFLPASSPSSENQLSQEQQQNGTPSRKPNLKRRFKKRRSWRRSDSPPGNNSISVSDEDEDVLNQHRAGLAGNADGLSTSNGSTTMSGPRIVAQSSRLPGRVVAVPSSQDSSSSVAAASPSTQTRTALTSSVTPPATTTPSVPSMIPIEEVNSSMGSGSSRAQSVTASFVGTADQVLGTGFILPASDTAAAAAVAYIDDDDDMLRQKKMEDDVLGVVQSVVSADADYKVDKADAPDVESMLRRAQEETSTDLEVSAPDTGVSHAGPIRRGKSDGSSVPLSQATSADQEVHNDLLKVVMVSDVSVDKTWVARAIRQSHKRPRKRATLGVDVHSWTPTPSPSQAVAKSPGSASAEAPVKFQIYDIQGATDAGGDGPNFGAHPGTQSLFFSAQSLYLLVWDLACNDPKTNRRQAPSRMRGGGMVDSDDDSDDEDDDDLHMGAGGASGRFGLGSEEDYEDEFMLEEANRQADRVLRADIADRVLSWVDTIARRGPKSAILPVAVIPEGMSESEVRRRCDMMQTMLEEHVIQHFPRLLGRNDTAPKLLTGADNILCVHQADAKGIEQLQETIVAIATDSTRSVFEHVGTPVPKGTVLVLDAIRRYRLDHKLILLDHLLGDLGSMLQQREMVTALHFLSSVGEIFYYGTADDEVLSRYIILSRKWFVSALSCILRNDLKRELAETRRFMNMQCIYSDHNFAENEVAQALVSGNTSSCPLLSDTDAKMLWQSMSFMREAADRYSQLDESSTTTPTMFYFLERLLVHAGIFLPLGAPSNAALNHRSEVFFVPILLAQADPRDVWTYKSSESWMTTLCYSWLFRDGAPSNLMERVTVGLLRDLYEYSRDFQGAPHPDRASRANEVPLGMSSMQDFLTLHDEEALGRIKIHQIMCWKSALLVKVGTCFADKESGEFRESFVEVFVAVVDQSSGYCVASDAMRPSMHRVVVSGKGQVGHHGLKLWKGGFRVILESIRSSLSNYPNVDSQVVCPECLAHSNSRSASTWSWDSVLAVAKSGSSIVRCMRGHRVDSNLICGTCRFETKSAPVMESANLHRVAKPVSDMLSSVVLVGLWDAAKKEICSVGSGFIVDKKLGLVVTAGHVLFNMSVGREFGSPYFGLRQAKAVIGVIPENGGDNAVFRYFAEIVSDDIQNVDACVLRIRTRMESDVDDEGAGCADQPEMILSQDGVVSQKLKSLKLTNRFELEESVRILGFNQGGEGVLQQGKHVNRSADFAKGYICKKFKAALSDDSSSSSESSSREINNVGNGSASNFSPREEIVIMCPTISGHSGGPCVNEEGKVVGILSRADPVDRQRCYLVPTKEIKSLISQAKKQISSDQPHHPRMLNAMQTM